MSVILPSSLLAVSDLEAQLHRTIGTKDQAAAEAAVKYAIAHVYDVLGFDITGATYDIDPIDMDLAKGVAVRIATQWFVNPEDRQSYNGPEGLSYTPSPQILSRIMSEADRRTLVSIQMRYAPGFA